jgi:hypothetical protein
MSSRAGEDKGGAGSSTAILARMNHVGTRVVFSHCPGCLEPLNGSPYGTGVWFEPRFKRSVQYHLCKPCGQRFERAKGRKQRRRLLETIERNLEQMGMITGLERKGGEA